MRYGRISELIRRSTGALLLLGSVGVSSDTLIIADDATCATPAPACADDVYKRAGERLAQQLQQMGSCAAPCAPACAAPAACAAAPAACGDNVCQPGCLSDGCHKGSCLFGGLFGHGDGCAEEKPAEPWLLIDQFTDECGKNCLKDNGITIGGWFEFGYQSKPDGAFTGNGPFLDDREWSKLNLSQMYLYIAKVADGSKGFDWGYRADVVYGVDGNESQSFGNEPGKWDFLNGWDHGIYEWGMPQLYAELAMGNLSVKLGHFWTPTGYDLYTAPDNFFYSRQITWYNGEPFTHTGALATYKVNDKLTVLGGWVLGWDTGFNQFNNSSMALTGLTYNASDKTVFTYFGAYGEFGWRGYGALNGVILSHKWTDKLISVHQFDVLATDNASDAVAPGGDFGTDGIPGDNVANVNYLMYQLTDKLGVGGRQEWYRADGTSYNTFTVGLNYKPHPNLIIRPEVRHMWAPGAQDGAAGTTAHNVHEIYGDNTVYGIDAIIKF